MNAQFLAVVHIAVYAGGHYGVVPVRDYAHEPESG